MRYTNEIESNWQMGTTIASGGTVTATGIDWGPYWEPHARMVVTQGATPSGTLAATLQQSDVLGSGYTDVGAIDGIGSTGGTAVYEVGGAVTARYVRVVATCTGGTSLMSASVIGKRRTITE